MRLWTKRFDVGDSGFKQADAILESTKSDVAVLAQQTAHGTSGMAVVHGQVDGSTVSFAGRGKFTNGADATLLPKHPIVVMNVDAVRVLETGGFSSLRESHGRVGIQDLSHVREIWVCGEATPIAWMLFAGSKMQVHAGPIKFLSTVSTWLKFPAARAEQFFAESVVGHFLTASAVVGSPLLGPSDTAIFTGVLKAIWAFVSFREVKTEALRRLARRAESFIRFQFWNVGTYADPVSSESLDFHISFAEAAGHVWHKPTVSRLREVCNSFCWKISNKGRACLT